MDSQYLNENEKECIKTIFNKYDKNNSDLLEKEELIKSFPELIELTGEHKNSEEIEVIVEEGIEKYDNNHKDALEYGEFTELMSVLILEKGLSFDYR